MKHDKRKSVWELLHAMVADGLPERRTEREAIALILETVTRIEAQQNDFLHRCSVLLSQQSARR